MAETEPSKPRKVQPVRYPFFKTVRMAPDELSLIYRVATREGVRMGVFMREAAVERARQSESKLRRA